jgi:hypothetical protein
VISRNLKVTEAEREASSKMGMKKPEISDYE